MAAAEDRVLKYMADNPGASVTEISDAIVTLGADLDIVADMMNVSRADARAAFAPTPAASDPDEGFDIMEALGLVGNINSSLSGASSFPVNQSPVIMNATPAGVGPNSPYALSASSEDDGNNVNLSSVAGSTYNTIGNLQNYNNVKAAAAIGDATIGDLANAQGTFAGGLGSIVGAISGKESKSESVVLNILSANPATAGFALAYRLFDAMGLGSKGSLATPMTPEEKEINDAAQQVDMAIDLSQRTLGNDFENEGEGETVEATVLNAFETVNALSDSGLEFFGDDKDALLAELANTGVDSSTSSQGVKGKWQDLMTGEVLPNFNPNTGSGSGTSGYYPIFIPDKNVTTDAASSSSSDSSTTSSDSSATAAADAATAAAAAAESQAASFEGYLGGEPVTWEKLIPYLKDAPTDGGGFESESAGNGVVADQLEEAAAMETDPRLKAALEMEAAIYRAMSEGRDTTALQAELTVFNQESADIAEAATEGANRVFTTATGEGDNLEDIDLGVDDTITVIDDGNGTLATDGDDIILTDAEKDAAFQDVLSGTGTLADVLAAAVEIYGNSADAVVAVVNALIPLTYQRKT